MRGPKKRTQRQIKPQNLMNIFDVIAYLVIIDEFLTQNRPFMIQAHTRTDCDYFIQQARYTKGCNSDRTTEPKICSLFPYRILKTPKIYQKLEFKMILVQFNRNSNLHSKFRKCTIFFLNISSSNHKRNCGICSADRVQLLTYWCHRWMSIFLQR